MINFDARNLSIFFSGDTVTSYASSHRAHEILSRFFEFSLEEITPIIICTSPLGAPCVHRWKLAPGWNAVNAWNRQPAIYQAFFLFSLFSFFFKLREQWQPRLFIADEYALAAVKPRHRVWNSSRLFVDLFSKTGEKTEMVGPWYSWRISVLDTVVGKQCHPRPFTALPMHLNAGASTRGVGTG